MTNQDDYNLILDEQEPDQKPQRSGSFLVWLIVALVLVIFGFAVGIAGVRLLTRVTENPTPMAGVATPTPQDEVEVEGGSTEQVATSETNVAAASPEVTTTETSTPVTELAILGITPTPLPETPTPAPVVCQYPIDPSLEPVSQFAALGCPMAPPSPDIWAAWEPFERGSMLWRSDNEKAYVFTDEGRWFPVEARWNGEAMASRGTPPPGLQQPARGFGYVWGADDAIFSAIGWAVEEEKGFCARIQEFERGFAVQSSPSASCTAGGLYNWATSAGWQPLLLVANDEMRLATGFSAESGASVEPDASTTESERATRPARHGTIFAAYTESLPTFDANFSEWPSAWQPLSDIVYDTGQFDGASDLQGAVQAAWSADGLLLAIRVNDDVYRPGPNGTDMWQGDGIEIHLDRNLSGDYDQWDASEDDYQIGVSFGPDLTQINGYRWLPYAEESATTLAGSVRQLQQGSAYRGYNAELLIPWQLFGLSNQDVNAGARYGFNVSLNDNDSIAPAQQTIISLSPARTTHDNPTEWGTLVLTQ